MSHGYSTRWIPPSEDYTFWSTTPGYSASAPSRRSRKRAFTSTTTSTSSGDSHRAGGDQAVRCRRREHHQPQLDRRLASGGGSPAVRFHATRHRNADQGIG